MNCDQRLFVSHLKIRTCEVLIFEKVLYIINAFDIVEFIQIMDEAHVVSFVHNNIAFLDPSVEQVV